MEGLVPVLSPWRISIVSSTLGSRTKTGWKRRSSAGSRSMFPRYSSSVVAPMTWSSPRARYGQHVRRVHGALGGLADHRMHLVDEEDQPRRPSSITVFNRSSNSPRYFVPAIIGEVERDHAIVGKRLGHLVVDDPLSDAFDDRRLPDSRLAQSAGCSSSAGEDLDRLGRSRPAAITGSSFLARLGRQVTAELVQLGCLRRFLRSAALDAADDGPPAVLSGDAETLEQLPCLGIGVRANASSTCSGPT